MRMGKLKGDDMQDAYKVAMFPLMMQALYNATVVLGSECANPPVMVDKGAFRPTLEDCLTVTRAFHSIGMYERFRKRVYEDGSISLRHFNDLEKEDIIRDFNPDQMEHDGELMEMEALVREKEREFKSRRKELRGEIDRLNKELDARNDTMQVMGELACAARERLTDALKYPMSKEEMRGEIAEAIRLLHGGQLRGNETHCVKARENPLDAEFADARKAPNRGRAAK